MIDNKYQLALNYLIENIEMLNRHSDGAFCLPYGSKKKLQELVNRATPNRVKQIEDHYFAETYEYDYSSGNCPHCGNNVYCDEYDAEPNYCFNCGQKLSWDNE